MRVIAQLASVGDVPATTKQLAAATRVPEGYLAKILQSLSKAGLVRSQRGPGGGSVLARPPSKITIYDVVQSVDPINRITTCPLGLRTHGNSLCPVHRRLDGALALVENSFRESTIADLLAEPSATPPLCEPRKPGRSAIVPLTTSRRSSRT